MQIVQAQAIVDTESNNFANVEEPIVAHPVPDDADVAATIVLDDNNLLITAIATGLTFHEQHTTTATTTATAPIDEGNILRLMAQGYSSGLALSLNRSKTACANRIWIVDNSGSMQSPDGHRLVPTTKKNEVRLVPCSRWEEIQECVRYHVELSGGIQAPTTFRLLNRPAGNNLQQEFRVCEGGGEDRSYEYSMQKALDNIRRTRPNGGTPLTSHVRDVHREISVMAPRLRATGQKVVLVVATDGLPTDSQGKVEQNHFSESLRLLEGLPVWVVVRLCTDDEEVVNFYNDLDSCLELSIEVLDDYTSEAKEIYRANPWLNYGLPLHRMREMGYHDRVLDMLDERLLTKTELRAFVSILFGEEHTDGVRDPSVDWAAFVSDVEELLKKEQPTWNPLKKKMKPWISIKKLNRIYKHGRIGFFS